MSASALALSALALTYLDARTLISEDLALIFRTSRAASAQKRLERQGKCNCFYILEQYAQSQPTAIALRFPKQVKPYPKEQQSSPSSSSLDDLFVIEEYTYKEVYDTVLKYAAVLHHQHGVTAQSIVALDCMNRPEFVFIWFACWSLGALVSFINYNLTEHSLVHCVKIADTTHLFVDDYPKVVVLVQPCESEIKNLGTKIAYIDDVLRAEVQASAPYRASNTDRGKDRKLTDACLLIYTSGTTGKPKATIMPWRKALVSPNLYAASIRLRSCDVVYSAMPLYHSTASFLGLLAAFNTGATYVIGYKFSTSTFWTQVKLTQSTYIQYVGETCRYLVNAPPSVDERAHKVVCAYGNGMRPDIWRDFKTRFQINQIGEFYASTESPSALTNFQQGELGVGAIAKYGSFASAILYRFRYRIVKMDLEDNTTILRNVKTGFAVDTGVNEPGELLARITNPDKVSESFNGYYGNSHATESKIVRNVFTKGDMYFRTGDLVRKDENNFIYFVDRLGDTFRWKSENVSTNEVEEVITAFDNKAHTDQVVVVGVQVPKHEGRAGFAVMALRDPARGKPDPAKLAHYLLAQLPRYAVPVFIKFVDKIAVTHNHKIQKNYYRDNHQFDNLSQEEEAKDDSTIWWLQGNTYVPLKRQDWDLISAGRIKL
jgi:acyl-CoA synthetase (AMP-forming)/AMP-acid ligase II